MYLDKILLLLQLHLLHTPHLLTSVVRGNSDGSSFFFIIISPGKQFVGGHWKCINVQISYSDRFSQTYWYNKYRISILCLCGQRLKFLNCDAFMSLKIVFIFANSADPDEMPPYVAFHLVLHCLPKTESTYLLSWYPG